MTRRNLSSNSHLEKTIGFSRAVRFGNIIAVSGTAPIAEDGKVAFPNDLYNQAKTCFGIMKKAIEAAGEKLENVIRIGKTEHWLQCSCGLLSRSYFCGYQRFGESY